VIAVSRRLPGIEVGVTPRPAAEALPRMDVAVLVGFASTGPVHVPVAIESVARFTEVFGADAPLAWDDTRGQRVFAYLGPAVRAFFANRGRRCWVIRVARDPIANSFLIPGVLSVGLDGHVDAGTATARTEGSWSDPFRVASALQRRSFAIDALAPAASPAATALDFRTRFGVQAGDLIELDSDERRCTYATVDAVRASRDANGPYTVQANVCAAFERLSLGSPASPPAQSGLALIPGVSGLVPATILPPVDQDDRTEIRFDEPVPARLDEGYWVRWSDGGQPVWLRIDEVVRLGDVPASPPATDATMMTAAVNGPAWRELGAALPITLAEIRSAHVLSLELRVDEGADQLARLNGIGLTPAHADAWWNHVSDADFYRPGEREGGSLIDAARQERSRFPLARAAGPLPRAWLPLGATALFGTPLPALDQRLTGLERDGLAQFDAGLFLDPELAGVPVSGIAELADAIRFVRHDTRPLVGLHAAWSIGAGGLFNEVSLLAVPDAIHLGWHKRPDLDIPEPDPRPPQGPAHWHTHRGHCAKPIKTPSHRPDTGVFLDCSTRALTAPELQGSGSPVPPGLYRLSWTDSEPAGSYVLLEHAQSDLSDPREIFRGTATEHLARVPREGIYYYRVFAHAGDETSGASNTVAVLVRSEAWVQNHPTREAGEALEREWLAVQRAALRLAAAGGDLFVALTMPRHFRTEQALRYAARLREVREPRAVVGVDAFDFTERGALSYGALYFPWLQSDGAAANRRRGGELVPPSPQVVPPDGVALGVLAARASSRGAWIAPANEPLQDVVAVTPVLGAADWQALLNAQINVLRQDPRGFLALSADTLAPDLELRPINVRRLLTLLRRLALRRGISYVFEPNGAALRRAVQRGFELLLTDLFRRGAFAGATIEESFRVVTDDTINTPRDAEAGRFLVELRVAPSVPMRFIAVQLAQSGGRLTVSEEL
jgi:hypothetical protein